MVIWTAGIKGNLPPGINKEMISPINRVRVDKFNKVIDSKNIFALGDIAFMESHDFPKGYPQLANVAIDQAKNLGMNFKHVAKGEIILEYKYKNKGTMATIGKNKAVVDLNKPKISFQGFWAWFVWMAIHLFLLIGFKNRVIVFINWAYQYFKPNQSFSLLFLPFLKSNNKVVQQNIPQQVEHKNKHDAIEV